MADTAAYGSSGEVQEQRALRRIAGGIVESLRVAARMALPGRRRGELTETLKVLRTIHRLSRRSYLGPLRLDSLRRIALDLDRQGIAGSFVECGVYQGGSAALLGYTMASSSAERELWLFDSFKGMPGPTERDGPRSRGFEGLVVGDERQVWKLMREIGAPLDRVHVVAGWFDETFVRAPVGPVALLHIDCDWYESVTASLKRFYPDVVPGGAIIIDDYYDWPGCLDAVEDFFAGRSDEVTREREAKLPPIFRRRA